jgi:hypothetical protein
LALNDNLQRVLRLHDDIAKGTSSVGVRGTDTPVVPLVNVNHEDDESEDDFGQLAHRKPGNTKTEPVRFSPVLPPPPASKKPIVTETGMIDYLSGDAYKSEGSHEKSEPTSFSVPDYSNRTSTPPVTTPTLSSSPPPTHFINPTASMVFTGRSVSDEPAPLSKSAEQQPPAPSPGSIPPPPQRYNQRQQFFEHQSYPAGAGHSSSGSSSSYDSLVGQTQNLSLNNTSTPTKQAKPEDALFKDLVDFAKAKSSSSSSPKPNRSF